MKKIIRLSLFTLAFSQTIAFAATLPASNLTPSKINRTLIKSPSGQENNYSQQVEENGASYCKSTFPESPLCVPFDNVGSTTLIVTIPRFGITHDAFEPQTKGALLRPLRRKNVEIIVKSEGNIIFDGKAKNKVGIVCTENTCKDWD